MDGDGDSGGDEGIVMKLVGGGTGGVDMDEIELYHCRGSYGVLFIGETSASVGEGAKATMGGVD